VDPYFLPGSDPVLEYGSGSSDSKESVPKVKINYNQPSFKKVKIKFKSESFILVITSNYFECSI
jgi:hypothetical protein